MKGSPPNRRVPKQKGRTQTPKKPISKPVSAKPFEASPKQRSRRRRGEKGVRHGGAEGKQTEEQG
jgi:hypothetical protein